MYGWKDEVTLVSPVLNRTGNVCLQFYYHMYGKNTGTLTVRTATYQKSIPYTDSMKQVMFIQSGSQGDEWMMGQFTIGQGQWVISFTATGASTSSPVNIAVDGVRLFNTECTIPAGLYSS